MGGLPRPDLDRDGLRRRAPIFNYTAQSTSSLAKLHVDFPVNVKPSKTVELYELMDDIVLRNSSRTLAPVHSFEGHSGAAGAPMSLSMRFLLCLPRRLRSERGMALVMAIGITSVLGIAGTTAIAYSTSGAQESQQSGSRQNAFSLAEAGINNSMSMLNLPTNNALDPDTLTEVHHQRAPSTRTRRADPDVHLDLAARHLRRTAPSTTAAR